MTNSHQSHRRPIIVGRITIPYSYALPCGWKLPDGSVTRNPIKAQYAAEAENEKIKESFEGWKVYEIHYLIEYGRQLGIASAMRKLERSRADVERMMIAIKGMQ